MAGALSRNCSVMGPEGPSLCRGTQNNQWGTRLSRDRETPCLPPGPLSQGYMAGGRDPDISLVYF